MPQLPSISMDHAFNEIVFLDDFFRTEENGLHSFPPNRRFLRGLFSFACQSLGIATREEHSVSSGGAIPVVEIMRQLNLPLTKEGWARSVIADLGSAFGKLKGLSFGKRSLIIGWGMPPSLLNYIDACGAAFIDVEVHALRFAQHLHLGVRTNCKKIAAVFSKIRVPDEVFEDAAIGIKALFSRRGDNALFCRDARVGIFLGQTEIDLALVAHGQLIGPDDVVEKVASLAAAVDILAVKPHPYQSNTKLLDALLSLPNAIRVDRNMYAMLCADNVDFVAGISSGALAEANFFGCRIEKLVEQDRNNAAYLPRNCTDWIPVGSEVASRVVMKDIVSRYRLPGVLRSRGRYRAAISAANLNLLDQAFGVRWGLQLDAAGLRCSPRVALNEEIQFGKSDAYVGALNLGWHEPEDWGAWSNEGSASLLLMVDTTTLPPAGRVQFTLSGSPYQPSGATSVATNVWINGKDCSRVQLDETSVSFLCDFDVKELRVKPLLIIEVFTRGAHRPCDVSGSTDARHLGLALRLLKAEVLNDISRQECRSAASHGLIEPPAACFS
jgi:hypothetical protein